MYEEFDVVLLKDGRFASLDNLDGPGQYTATVGDGPKDWEIITVTDDDIARRLTQPEIREWCLKTDQQYKECGIL